MTRLSPTEALARLWQQAGGRSELLQLVTLIGEEPVLPSSFAVGTLAQVTIAAAALAAADVHRTATGRVQSVSVDMQHAAVEFRSERYLRTELGSGLAWDKIAGVYRTGDGHWVRLHTNFPHHRKGILDLLGASYERDAVQRALLSWEGEAFENEVAHRGLVATTMRSLEEWEAHPQGQAVAGLPLLEIIQIADAPPRPLPNGGRPLGGLRVLDLTRVIAGPVCARTLAAHGADVLHIASPHLPSIPGLVMDTGRGKLSAFLDLNQNADCTSLENLVRDADVFVQGYRPGSLAARGFSPSRCAELSAGIIYVTLSAYGSAGPWADRRGFDSLVQTATGFNDAEAIAAHLTVPKELPAQALDHGAGYLMAFATIMALLRRAREGGSWHIRISLEQTGHWLKQLGRVASGHAAPDPKFEDVTQFLETGSSGFGRMTSVRHAAQMSYTPAIWSRPSVPLGTHPPVWPPRDTA
jgi:crotonobetainyl-CoA:carnitine CoA-transferase CaiB-like acyl-CoA transferase